MKLWPLLIAGLFVACAPAYSGSRNAAPMEVTGLYLGVFYGAGDLDAQVLNELGRALPAAGFRVTGLKYPEPQGANVKLEGDLVAAQGSGGRATKFSKAEVRVIEFKTGRTVAQYRFETGNPLEMRAPNELARDVAGLMKKDFRQLP